MGNLPANTPPEESALFDIRQVAGLLRCSTRHVRRLADAGAMPAPVRLGVLLRWRREELQRWLDAGCPRRK